MSPFDAVSECASRSLNLLTLKNIFCWLFFIDFYKLDAFKKIGRRKIGSKTHRKIGLRVEGAQEGKGNDRKIEEMYRYYLRTLNLGTVTQGLEKNCISL